MGAKPYGFTGKEEDVEVGLVYFGKRFYAPALQRWVSADPLEVHSGRADPNPYAYVGGKTLLNVDPLGLDPGDVWLYGPIENDRFLGPLIKNIQNVLDEPSAGAGDVDYVHSSIEVAEGQQFSSGISPTVETPGSHVESNASILERMVVDPADGNTRIIDVFRADDVDFDQESAQGYADQQAGNWNYLEGGSVCSTEVTAAAWHGGMDVGTGDHYTSPADLSRTPGLQVVGRYDGFARMSVDAPNTPYQGSNQSEYNQSSFETMSDDEKAAYVEYLQSVANEAVENAGPD